MSMCIKQEPDTVIEHVREVEPDSSDTRDRKNKIINEDSLLQVKTECYIEGEDSALPNSVKSHGLWLDFIKPDMSDQVSTLDDSRIDNRSSQTDGWTQLEPDCSDRDVKMNNAECLPQVKTECCLVKDGPVLNSIKSEEQRLNFNMNIANVSSCQEGYCDNTDSLQKTRVLPNNLQASYTYVTGTQCENQDMPLEDGKESLVHCFQKVVKSDLNIPTDTNTDGKICVSRDVNDFHKYLLTSDDVFPSQQDQVKLYECVACLFSSNHLFELHQHKTSHKMEHFYVCDLCQTTYQYFLDLKCHLKSHTAQDEISLQLFYDSKKYSSEIQAFQNVQRREEISTKNKMCIEKRENPIGKPYSCDFCDFTCAHSGHLKEHRRKHTGEKPYTCDLCDFACALSSGLRQHKRKHTGEKPYSCDLCDFTCAYLANFKRHKEKHTGEKTYSCDLCDFTSAYLANLKRHKEKHRGEKPYSCDSGSLKEHERKHTRKKPYSCDICGYACAIPSQLKKHKRKHTGEKPYTCDLCDYASASSCHLKEHKRKHTGEKPYSCDLCDYASAQLSNFKQHKRKHTGEKPYTCDLCDYASAHSGRLKEHKRKHSGEKPYSCDLCDFTCATSGNLKIHKTKHTGENLLSCDQCDYASAWSSTLKRHKITHTGKKTIFL